MCYKKVFAFLAEFRLKCFRMGDMDGGGSCVFNHMPYCLPALPTASHWEEVKALRSVRVLPFLSEQTKLNYAAPRHRSLGRLQEF